MLNDKENLLGLAIEFTVENGLVSCKSETIAREYKGILREKEDYRRYINKTNIRTVKFTELPVQSKFHVHEIKNGLFTVHKITFYNGEHGPTIEHQVLDKDNKGIWILFTKFCSGEKHRPSIFIRIPGRDEKNTKLYSGSRRVCYYVALLVHLGLPRLITNAALNADEMMHENIGIECVRGGALMRPELRSNSVCKMIKSIVLRERTNIKLEH
jgi:hypothetical protein